MPAAPHRSKDQGEEGCSHQTPGESISALLLNRYLKPFMLPPLWRRQGRCSICIKVQCTTLGVWRHTGSGKGILQPHLSEISPAPYFQDPSMPQGLAPVGLYGQSPAVSRRASKGISAQDCALEALTERPVVRRLVLSLLPCTSSMDEALLIQSALCNDYLFPYRSENNMYGHQPFYLAATWAAVRSQGTPNQYRWYLFIA